MKVATQSPSTISVMLLAMHSATIDSTDASRATSKKRAKISQSSWRKNAKTHFITSSIATPATISASKETFSK